MGGTAYGNPADYVVHDGRIYILGSDACHEKFAAAPAKYLPRPATPMDSSDAARSKGRLLVEKAVDALGGAERLDAIATYVETSRQTQTRGQDQVVVTSRMMWKFPGAARLERSMTMQGRQMSSANVLSPAGAWFVGQQGTFPVNPAGRPFLEQEIGREIVPLLRARKDASFQAAAVSGDAVRIRNGAVDVIFRLEAGSGRILSATFDDRNGDGEIGETVIAYADYRDAGGLSLPFSRQALFNGAPNPIRTRAIDAITINEPLADALFAPTTGRQ
jgi:hypothetical protein